MSFKKVIIYSGRFQPMLGHHAEVYHKLTSAYPDAEVYIGTSNKTELGRSPFNFKDKQQIAAAHGIDPSKVLFSERPYTPSAYEQYFDEEQTSIAFAVGEKDIEKRFPQDNVDPNTGLDMKLTDHNTPKYFQMINTYSADPMPMSQRGYIMPVPNVMEGDKAASATQFREEMLRAPDIEAAKEVYVSEFGQYKEDTFNLVYDKIRKFRAVESEQFSRLRQLAGIKEQNKNSRNKSMNKTKMKEMMILAGLMEHFAEDGPAIEYDTALDTDNIDFSPAGDSPSEHSIAHRMEGDPNDQAVKKEAFLKALLQSPAALIGEINERIKGSNDSDNNMAVSAKLNDIMDVFTSDPNSNINSLDEDDKRFVIQVVATAIKKMELVSPGEPEGEEEIDPTDDFEFEGVDMTDAKREAGLEEEDDIHEMTCPCCKGGKCSHGKDVCGTCGGSGRVEDKAGLDEMDEFADREFGGGGGPYPCTKCDGKGHITSGNDTWECEACMGYGEIDPYNPKPEQWASEVEDDEEDWMDPAGGMHSGGEKDPAKMYEEEPLDELKSEPKLCKNCYGHGCSMCDGEGQVDTTTAPKTKKKSCHNCKGKGCSHCETNEAEELDELKQEVCSSCKGKGCESCDYEGTPEPAEYKFKNRKKKKFDDEEVDEAAEMQALLDKMAGR